MDASGVDVERDLTTLRNLELLHQPYVNSAYVTGSLLAGLGTPTSDLNVIVLVGDADDKELARRAGALRRHGPNRADFQVFTLAEFASAIEECADASAAWEKGRIYRLAQPVRLVSQFTAAMQVLKPSQELARFADLIAGARSDLVRISVLRAVIYGNNAHEDLLGMAEQGDEVGVLRQSHEYLKFGLDAWCTCHGALYPDVTFKWLWRRLNLTCPGAQELAALRDVYVSETAALPVAEVPWLRIDIAQALLAQALLTAAAADPAPLRAPVLPRQAGDRDALWRSPQWMAMRTSDAWGLGSPVGYRKVPVATVVAWAFASGRDSDELEEVTMRRTRAVTGTALPPAGAQAAIRWLADHGAIGRVPQSARPSTPVL
jgi:hypothetical protein